MGGLKIANGTVFLKKSSFFRDRVKTQLLSIGFMIYMKSYSLPKTKQFLKLIAIAMNSLFNSFSKSAKQ